MLNLKTKTDMAKYVDKTPYVIELSRTPLDGDTIEISNPKILLDILRDIKNVLSGIKQVFCKVIRNGLCLDYLPAIYIDNVNDVFVMLSFNFNDEVRSATIDSDVVEGISVDSKIFINITENAAYFALYNKSRNSPAGTIQRRFLKKYDFTNTTSMQLTDMQENNMGGGIL